MARFGFTDEDLVTRAERLFSAAESYKVSAVKDAWQDNLKHYHNEHLKTPRSGRSKLFIPKTRIAVRRIQAAAMEAFFSSYDIVTVEPRKGPDSEGAKAREEILNYRLNGNPINFYGVGYTAVEDALVYNIAVLKIWWDRVTVKHNLTVEVPDPATGEPLGEREVEVVEITRDEPVMENIAPEDYFIDPRVPWYDYQSASFMIFRQWKTVQELLEGERDGVYQNVSAIMHAPGSQSEGADIVAIERSENVSPFATDVRDKEKIELHEVWERVPVPDGEGKQRIKIIRYVVIPQTAVISGPDPSPYKHGKFPVVVGMAIPESHRFYSPSFVELMQHLQIEINGIRNQRRDNIALLLNGHHIVSRQARANLESLANSRPGGITIVDGDARAAVSPLVSADYTSRAVEEETLADRDIQEFSAVTSDSLGVASQRRQELATVTMTRLDQRQIIERLTLRTMAETIFQPAAEMLMWLEEQYESDERVFRYVGHRMGVASPEDDIPSALQIKANFRVKTQVGLGSVSKDVKVRNMLFLMDKMMQIFGPQPQLAMAFLKEIGPLMGVQNIDEFLRVIASLPPAQPPGGATGPGGQQQQQAAAQGGGGGNAGGPPLPATDVSNATHPDIRMLKGLMNAGGPVQ